MSADFDTFDTSVLSVPGRQVLVWLNTSFNSGTLDLPVQVEDLPPIVAGDPNATRAAMNELVEHGVLVIERGGVVAVAVHAAGVIDAFADLDAAEA